MGCFLGASWHTWGEYEGVQRVEGNEEHLLFCRWYNLYSLYSLLEGTGTKYLRGTISERPVLRRQEIFAADGRLLATPQGMKHVKSAPFRKKTDCQQTIESKLMSYLPWPCLQHPLPEVSCSLTDRGVTVETSGLLCFSLSE